MSKFIEFGYSDTVVPQRADKAMCRVEAYAYVCKEKCVWCMQEISLLLLSFRGKKNTPVKYKVYLILFYQFQGSDL